MRIKAAVVISVLVVGLSLMGCDPQQLVNDYFKNLGLNPLATVRDDIKPGALILKNGSNAVLADSIFSYNNGANVPVATTTDINKIAEFKAVLRQYKSDRTVSASTALDFLQTVLPINIDVDLGLTNSASIDAINADGNRLAAPAVQQFLSNNSSGLHDFMMHQQAGTEAYVAYETYSADTLNIVAQGNANISTTLQTSAQFKPLSSANASFKYSRTNSSTLVIKSDHPYVFAIRTAKLVYKNDIYYMQVTNFASGVVKAAGGNEKYSAPVETDFAPLKLKK